MPEGKRVRRTPQQMAQDLDAQMEKLNASIAELEEKKTASAAVFDGKIAAVREKIKKLEAKKKDVLAPKKRKTRKTKAQQIKDLVRKAQKAGLKPDEIASRLGVSIEEYARSRHSARPFWPGAFLKKYSESLRLNAAGFLCTASANRTGAIGYAGENKEALTSSVG